MILSVNECEGLIIRAARGAQLPLGLGEDLAHAAIWLEAAAWRGMACVEAALRADMYTVQNPPRLRTERSGWSLVGAARDRPLAALHSVSLVMDLIQLGQDQAARSATIVAEAVDQPLLLVAAAGLVAERKNCSLVLQISLTGEQDGLQFNADGKRMACSGDKFLLDRLNKRSASVMIRACNPRQTNARSARQWTLHDARRARALYDSGIAISASTLGALKALAHETLVPASETSRLLGAGASALDND